jgi:hypothetical protein
MHLAEVEPHHDGDQDEVDQAADPAGDGVRFGLDVWAVGCGWGFDAGGGWERRPGHVVTVRDRPVTAR